MKDLINDLSQDCEAKRAIGYRGGVPYVLGVIAYYIAIAVFLGFAYDLENILKDSSFILEIFLTVSTFLLSSYALFRLRIPDCKGVYQFAPFISFTALAVIILANTNHNVEIDILHGCKCMLHVFLISIPPILFSIYYAKKGCTTNPLMLGCIVGLGIGSTSYLILRLTEMTDDILHLFMWHLLPIIVLSMVLSVLGYKIFKW